MDVVGRRGEELAARHLEAAGWRVLARNWRIRGEVTGELDVVAVDPDGTLVIVEVKTRRGDRYGTPLEAVPPAKQRRLQRLAAAFLATAGVRAARIRFDVVGVAVSADGRPRLTHIRGAF